MKKITTTIVVVLVVIIGLVALDSSWFVLAEGECAVVQRFGSIEGMYVKEMTPELEAFLTANENTVPVKTGTGFKLKIPFIDKVITYSSKLISYETATREVITSDKRKLYFDNNAQWQIINPYLFYMKYNNISNAKKRIDDILYSKMNEKVGEMLSHTLITDKAASTEMLELLTNEVSGLCSDFGVRVIDVRIKRTDLPQENYESIYNRMNTERGKIAAQHRSEGDEESIKIRSQTDREVITITSESAKTAEILKGEGDSEAAQIYNEVYGKNPEFYEFYNLLETYKVTLGSSSTLVVPLDSPFAKYLLGAPMPQTTNQPTEQNP